MQRRRSRASVPWCRGPWRVPPSRTRTEGLLAELRSLRSRQVHSDKLAPENPILFVLMDYSVGRVNTYIFCVCSSRFSDPLAS